MSIKFKFMSSVCVLAAALLLTVSSATAQLSSPIAGGTNAGTGAGVHSPNSPFKPLSERADVLSWAVLTDVKTKIVKGSITPIFNAQQMALHKKNQRIQGFMMPLGAGEKQTHFLISSVPMNCGFCTPGGPESMVEIRTKTPVKYSMEPVVVEGNFQVLVNDPFGVYYKIVDATPVK